MKEIGKFWQWFWYGNSKSDTESGKKIIAKTIKKIFGNCPVCKKNFSRHQFAPFAQAVFVSENQQTVDELFKKVQRENWSQIVKIQEFDGLQDCVCFEFFKCPDGFFYWTALFLPYELFEEIHVIEYAKIDAKYSDEIENLIEPKYWYMIK